MAHEHDDVRFVVLWISRVQLLRCADDALPQLPIEGDVPADSHFAFGRIPKGFEVEQGFDLAVTDEFAILRQLEVGCLAGVEGGIVVGLKHDACAVADQIVQQLDVRGLVWNRHTCGNSRRCRIVGDLHEVPDLVDHAPGRRRVGWPRYPSDFI